MLVAVVVVWQLPARQPDAGEVYADIMASASFSTDALLISSHGLSPESMGTPSVLDFSMDFGEVVQ